MRRFELKALTEYTESSIWDEIRRVAQLHAGGPFTLQSFKRLLPRVSPNTVRRRFGDWKTALQKAGLEHLSREQFLSPSEKRIHLGRNMSDDDLIKEMQRVHRLSGAEVLTKTIFDQLSVTQYEVVRERFGNWHKALDRAGIGKSALGKRYTDSQCFENLANLWTHYGRQPYYRETLKAPSTVGPKAYVLRWGNWRKTLKAFVDWANADEAEFSEDRSQLSPIEITSATAISAINEDPHDIPLRLRWKVLVRDRFRCRACGRSPANNLSVELHVDHIEPWADSKRTILENLQTLCEDCNLGKGRSFAKVE